MSSELSERQALARIAAQVIGVPWLRLYELGPSEAKYIAASLDGLSLYVVRPRKGQPILDLLNRATDEIGAAPVLTFDYLQHAARRLAIEDRRIAVGSLMDDIGTWVTDTRSTALVVSAVARGHYSVDDDATAEDHLGAGKETGDIEFDASAELFLRAELPPEGGSAPAKLHVTKNRFGSSGQTVGLLFHGATGCFTDDPQAALSPLELECLRAIAAGERTYEAVRARVEAGKGRVSSAIRSLIRQNLVEGPPLRALGDVR